MFLALCMDVVRISANCGETFSVLALNSWYQVTAGAWLASHGGIKDRDLVVGLNGYSSAPRDSPARQGEMLRALSLSRDLPLEELRAGTRTGSSPKNRRMAPPNNSKCTP
jgi:hypothetical protein